MQTLLERQNPSFLCKGTDQLSTWREHAEECGILNQAENDSYPSLYKWLI